MKEVGCTWLVTHGMRIQRASLRSVFTVLKLCDPPDTCKEFRAYFGVCAFVRECVRVGERVCVCVSERERECVCERERDREGLGVRRRGGRLRSVLTVLKLCDPPETCKGLDVTDDRLRFGRARSRQSGPAWHERRQNWRCLTHAELNPKSHTGTPKLALVLEGAVLEAAGSISQKSFIKSFGESQFPHKSVNLSFIITNIRNRLTDLGGN